MKTLQSSYTVPGVFVLLLSAVLLSLASCGGGGGSNGGGSPAITVSAISAGSEHTCAILSTGAAKCWGENFNGQLGDDSTDDSNLPAAVVQTPADTSDSDKHTSAVLLDSGVTAISAGGGHTCAIHNGAAKCWGNNGQGRLGDGSDTESNIPVAVADLGSGVTAISAGGQHTCAVHNGAAQCWGLNRLGQLGDGTGMERLTPTQVSELGSGVIDISAGQNHTCAIHNTGTEDDPVLAAKCWGSNFSGKLGDGSDTESNIPVAVADLDSDVTAISAGANHTCAVHNGAAKCWGSDSKGKLGNGSSKTRNQTEPMLVGETGSELSSGVSAISAGNLHTCAVQNTKAWCWGDNSMGQLGVNIAITAAESHRPVAVETTLDGKMKLSGVTAISAGLEHTCALLATGVVQCWGSNVQGQLGVGALPDGDATTLTPQTLSFK